MTTRFTFLVIFLFSLSGLNSQVNNGYLNKLQKKIYDHILIKNGVRGYIEYEYPNETQIKNGPSRFNVVFIDSLGNTIRSISYAQDKSRKNYFICEQNQFFQVIKKYFYTPDNNLFVTDESIYDARGEVIESIQRDAKGTVSSKTKVFYGKDGFISKSEMYGQDGKLNSVSSVEHDAKGLPVYVSSKHSNGMALSTDSLRYNQQKLLVEKKTKITITGKSFIIKDTYDANNLLVEQLLYRDGKIENIKKTEYFGKNFIQYLTQHGFNLEAMPTLQGSRTK